MDLCPLIFEPHYVPKVWGGRRLSAWGKSLPPEPVGESWELYDDAQGGPRVAAGPAKGLTLRQVSAQWGADLVGPGHEAWSKSFPLMIKWLDAREDLSVQVHPSDAQAAAEAPGQNGKDEFWVVLEATPGARLYNGWKAGTDEAQFRRALADGSVESLLQPVAVKAGDVIDIPAGRVHALGAGCLVAEVQQNSQLTYRVWDYGRLENGLPRELHVDQACRALRFDAPFAFDPGLVKTDGEGLVSNSHFDVQRLSLATVRTLAVGPVPKVLMTLQGQLNLAWGAGQGMMVPAGATVLVPAALELRVAPGGAPATLLLIEPR